MLGLNLNGVVIRMPKSNATRSLPVPSGDGEGEASDEQEERRVPRMVIDRIGANIGLLPLIFAWQRVIYVDVEAFRGEISGRFRKSLGGDVALQVAINDIDLARIVPLQEMVGIPVEGKLNLEGHIEIPMRERKESKKKSARRTDPKPRLDPGKAEGDFEMACNGCALGDGKAKLKIRGNAFLAQGITLPRVSLGKVNTTVSIKKGTAQMKELAVRSEDLEADLDATITLRQPFDLSVVQGFLRFKIGAALKERAKQIPFDIIEGSLSRGKMPDGAFGLAISGMLRKPRGVLASSPP